MLNQRSETFSEAHRLRFLQRVHSPAHLMDSLRVLPIFLLLFSASAGLKQVNVESAENIRLDCQGPKNANITLLEWKRHDLLSEGYVFFYRDGRLHKTFQHPVFKDRVELSDPKMKNGNLSIILYNTTVNDTGTYECRIIVRNAGQRSSATSEIRHRTRLRVVNPPGRTTQVTEVGNKKKGFKIYRGAGVLAIFAVLAAIVMILIWQRPEQQQQ